MSAMVDKGPSNALAKLNSQVGASRHAQGVRPDPQPSRLGWLVLDRAASHL
jgi:hypothetical protein